MVLEYAPPPPPRSTPSPACCASLMGTGPSTQKDSGDGRPDSRMLSICLVRVSAAPFLQPCAILFRALPTLQVLHQWSGMGIQRHAGLAPPPRANHVNYVRSCQAPHCCCPLNPSEALPSITFCWQWQARPNGGFALGPVHRLSGKDFQTTCEERAQVAIFPKAISSLASPAVSSSLAPSKPSKPLCAQGGRALTDTYWRRAVARLLALRCHGCCLGCQWTTEGLLELQRRWYGIPGAPCGPERIHFLGRSWR